MSKKGKEDQPNLNDIRVEVLEFEGRLYHYKKSSNLPAHICAVLVISHT